LTGILFVIVIVLAALYRLNAPKIKGTIGESRVVRQLDKLPNQEYKVLNEVLIRIGNGSSQIDHVIISIYGIFVIETKNYSGWIHGNENSEYWAQSIYKKKTKFRNPIKQNWAHIYALKEALSNFEQIKYHPIIVFAGSAKLKNINSKIPVIYHFQLYQTIMDNRRIRNLSIEQVDNIVDKLKEVNIQDKKAKKEHVHQVHNHAFERKQKEKSLICPRCGGNLVIRDGPFGKFYGCLNYPNCRYKLTYKA
jgi:hypothetical protein